MKNLEIYIHIPFCVRKCEYCDFLSFPADDDAKLRYVKGLMAEMIFYGPLMKNYQVSSVYIGGGTPSSIDEQWIAALMEGVFDCFNVLPDAEISIECNPGTLSREKLLAYRDAGINRLSIGLQSANNDELKLLGRIHTFEQFVTNYEVARNVGFKKYQCRFDVWSAGTVSVTVYGDSKQDYKASSGSYIGVFSYSGKGYSFL